VVATGKGQEVQSRRLYRFEAGLQEFGDQVAEPAEIAPTVAEEWPHQLWQGEYVLLALLETFIGTTGRSADHSALICVVPI
jgi:hypothetical protein